MKFDLKMKEQEELTLFQTERLEELTAKLDQKESELVTMSKSNETLSSTKTNLTEKIGEY